MENRKCYSEASCAAQSSDADDDDLHLRCAANSDAGKRLDAPSLRATELARHLHSDERIRVAIQSAHSTRETLEYKYRTAESLGAEVLGLDDLISALDATDTTRIAGCTMQGQEDFVLVFLSPDLAAVIGVLSVDPGRAASD